MSKSVYYPPIPGRIGKRGRPSVEEMEERRKYWESQGGPPKDETKNVIVVRNESTNVRGAQPVMDTINVPEDIRKLIGSCPVALSEDDYKAIEVILKNLPPSHRGRQSKEEMEAKTTVKNKINSFIVDKIRSNKIETSEVVEELNSSDLEEFEEIANESKPVVTESSSNTLGKYTQFKFGDRVRLIPELVIGNVSDRAVRGVVARHDIGTMSVYVNWDDGASQYHPSAALVRYYPSLESGKELYRQIEKKAFQFATNNKIVKVSEIRDKWCKEILNKYPKLSQPGIEPEMVKVAIRFCSDYNVFVDKEETA